MTGYRSIAGGLSARALAQSRGIAAPFSLRQVMGDTTRSRMVDRIHQHYLGEGGRSGPFGFPTSDVTFSGGTALRSYRGGLIRARSDPDSPLGVITQALEKSVTSVRFLGFRCVSLSDELSASDEPYFIIAVDHGVGVPVTKKFGPFENTKAGTERGVGEVLAEDFPPDPMAIRVLAFENDEGDPDETAEELQAKLVELAQAVQSAAAASGADAASGAGIGPAASAGAVGLLAGPLGALLAVGIVSLLGLGDDFVGQDVALAFTRPEDGGTPPKLGEFRGIPFNAKVDIDGREEGRFELFFDIHVAKHIIETQR